MNIGQRVTRQIFLDDGVWRREGDKCLARSPLKHGEIVKIARSYLTLKIETIVVRWDNGPEQTLLPHGVDLE